MSQDLPEGTVTILFTDAVGSTTLTTRQGDEAAQEILRARGHAALSVVRALTEFACGHTAAQIKEGR
jgi:class 3 adenylate cyclase